MLILDQLKSAVLGDEPISPRPRPDEAAEVAALEAEWTERKPTFERGRDWLTQARSDTPFLVHHCQEIIGAVPALRISATGGWIRLMDDGWNSELDVDTAIRLLAAMLAWQVAASQRALTHFGIEVTSLADVIWEPLITETLSFLQEQAADESVMPRTRRWADAALPLVELALSAPPVGEDAPELIDETRTWCGLKDDEDAAAELASQWRIMDAAAIAVWYRSFGEQLQRQYVG